MPLGDWGSGVQISPGGGPQHQRPVRGWTSGRQDPSARRHRRLLNGRKKGASEAYGDRADRSWRSGLTPLGLKLLWCVCRIQAAQRVSSVGTYSRLGQGQVRRLACCKSRALAALSADRGRGQVSQPRRLSWSTCQVTAWRIQADRAFLSFQRPSKISRSTMRSTSDGATHYIRIRKWSVISPASPNLLRAMSPIGIDR
jgi:hypothetical protein